MIKINNLLNTSCEKQQQREACLYVFSRHLVGYCVNYDAGLDGHCSDPAEIFLCSCIADDAKIQGC